MPCLGENTVLALVDALIEPARRADVEAHTASCASCRRLISALAGRSLARASAPASEVVASSEGARTAPPLGSAEPGLGELAPGTAVGRFIVQRVLGRGAMGAVYAARDPELEREVALKILHADEQQRARIQHEARALARLAHPNVVTAYELGTAADGGLVLAMELVDGEPLRAWMQARAARPAPTVDAIVDVFVQLGRGLAAAHAAGLVHRDVKPDNAVVGRDGRARLIDFGLAGRDGGTELVGTPAYMAPEQLEDGGADARSDQFAFCVALYEALHGERPFVVNLRDEVARGLSSTRKLAPSLTAALARGLALDPAARFADMPALLAAIAPRPRSRRRIFVAVAALAVVALAGAWGAVRPGVREAAACDARAALASTWSPARARALRARFDASGVAYAASTWRAFEAGTARFAHAWIAGQTDACEARGRGTQSESIFTLRSACYARALAEADGVLAVYERGPAIERAAIERAASAADTLSAASCGNLVALLAPVPPPSARDAAIASAALNEVARANAARAAARWPDALARASAAVATASTIEHAPTRAVALVARGQAESGGGDAAHAEASLREAYTAAARGHDDLSAARAAVELVWVLGHQEERYADGLEWAFQADTAIARAGGDADLAARLANNRGNIFYDQNKFDDARAAYQRALDLRVEASGAASRGAAQMTANLSRAVMAQGNNPEARVLMTRAIAGLAGAVGADHPDLATATSMLAALEFNEGKWDAALASFDRTLAIAEPALGPEHLEVARALCGRGFTLTALGRARGALPDFARAIAICEPGPNRTGNARLLVENLLGLADAQRLIGDRTAALATCQRALAIDEASFGARSEDAARAHECIGDVLAALDRHADALATFRLALDIRDEVDPPDYVEKSHALSGIGVAEHRRGNAAAAVAPLRRAVALLAAYDGDAAALAQARFAFARALWDAHPGDATARAGALAAVAAAEPALVAAGAPSAADLAALRTWQRTHR